MTETVVLAVEDLTLTLTGLAELVRPVGAASIAGPVMTFRQGQDAGYIVEVTDPEADGVFEDWPPDRIPTAPCVVFSVDYREPDLVLVLVQAIARRYVVTVDTNYGRVVPGKELTRHMLSYTPPDVRPG
ncbi:hypothetical protein SAMN05421812_10663 [Asanoa hainanensis]|uniref:Uncharacterized protein n=1 Tax=Asanoa hainanensis TaxID=560556 RepID=A0A239MPU8_9ACTN|nr:hypothetical protein [Asanoa hainanensis]SNT43998.1 hypothetical protein SAMN05421812_10663 [Asanoa hainanensis]